MNKGIPIFKVDELNNETYLDEKGQLNVFIGIDKIFISFSENEIVSIVQNDNVGFAIDTNETICGIIVNDVEEHEKKIIEDALK
ncbi:hypothetical protein B4100_3873 [Heyndrickxia coagulans]|uniref:Uncharacterized protein n=1 Tax=Heyndrickxia coagulans TaxID=1398 RepID=A0A150JXX6_HEYCO|nr:hypothetical protein B4100_3873 [Heyndrickxia coagulans]KYC68765.1 hypothetical protein B4099_3721 [Heyndrickxia coagulans]